MKIKQIVVCSKDVARFLSPPPYTAAFRIIDSPAMKRFSIGTPYVPLKRKLYSTVFEYVFDDIDLLQFGASFLKNIKREYGRVIVFDKATAKKIVGDFESIMDSCETVLIHCNAGVSRSRATAAAIMDIFNIKKAIVNQDGTWEVVTRQWIEEQDYNHHVYKTLLLSQIHRRRTKR